MSFYPAGVTGNEFEIAGPDDEWEEVRECVECGTEHVFTMARFGGFWWGQGWEADCDAYIEGECVERDGD